MKKKISVSQTTWGTCHFPSENAALRYYQKCVSSDYTAADILAKIQNKEIVIGRPTTKLNETVYLDESEERYYIRQN